MTGTVDKWDIAERWITTGVRNLFLAEIANERDGGVSPATLDSTIDSVQQGGAEVFGLDTQDLIALLSIRNILPKRTKVRDLLQ
jgi:hypothetical protein